MAGYEAKLEKSTPQEINKQPSEKKPKKPSQRNKSKA
ncbi:hypothetical protein J2Z26_003092 [Bacillus luteolus]|nr:hypothetical protein [Cytobacillus luteolus]